MVYAVQQISNTVSTPSVTWFTDTTLSPPVLTFPADGARYCPSFTPKISSNSGVRLSWSAVSGADFYIVQISQESQQFSGPGLKSIKTTNTYHDLLYLDEVRMGQTLYWRVFAHTSLGGQSVSSLVRSCTLDCPSYEGTGKNPEDPASTIDAFSCDAIGSDIKIIGASTLRKGETDRLYVVDLAYDCKTFDGNEVTVSTVTWSISRPDPDVGTTPVVTIESQNDQYVKLSTSSDLIKPHTFDLKVEVEFTSASLNATCSATKRILVEGTSGGGAPIIMFEITDAADCGSGCVTAEVTGLAVGNAGVDIGDSLTIYDAAGCFFNVDPVFLVGAVGFACEFQGDSPCTDYTVESSHWRVTSLCCLSVCP